MRRRVAEWPRKRPRTPAWALMSRIAVTTPNQEPVYLANCGLDAWKRIFTRSRGPTTVLAWDRFGLASLNGFMGQKQRADAQWIEGKGRMSQTEGERGNGNSAYSASSDSSCQSCPKHIVQTLLLPPLLAPRLHGCHRPPVAGSIWFCVGPGAQHAHLG
jgi:hypothetical protein